MQISLPELFWYEKDASVDIDLPDGWEVTTHPMRGGSAPPLSLAQMAEAIRNPVAGPPLRELARGRKKAVIVFDDMTRPTRVDELGPIVISELLEAGIPEDRISFVCALGTHGALSQIELRRKVGARILERFRVYNHNCYENCVEVGTTARGTHVRINAEVMSADLKVGLGTVTAHAQAGFSGGGKIILPGVAHIDSIAHYHIEVEKQGPTGLGNWDENVMRLNIREAAQMVGLDFKVDVLVNERCVPTHVFAGSFPEAHDRAVDLAKEHYATSPRPQGKDIVISNAFCKPNEMPIALLVGLMGLSGLEGSVVIIANAPEGQVVHYLLGRFGETFGGRQYPISRVPRGLSVIIQAPHFDRTFGDWFHNPEAITWTRSWAETKSLLEQKHGASARVGVIPNGTMAYHRYD